MKLQIVPPGTGLQWVLQGLRTFKSQPLALAALFFLGMASMSLISALPLIGPVIALALLPCISLTMMVAASEAAHGRKPTPALLLVAFRSGSQHLHSMLMLGGLYAAGFLLIIGASSLVDGGTFASVYLGQTPMTRELAEEPEFQSAMWLSMFLYLPLSLAFWHAPALIHWHGISPVKSLFFSFVGCIRNIGAYLVFGVCWIGVFIVSGMALAIVTGILAMLIGSIAGGLMVATALMLAAIFFTSIVFTFRDSFSPPDADQTLTDSSSDTAPPSSDS
ncbi:MULTISPECIES: BPSS1780 family membrane protein [Comamonas]|uniref:Membrane protein n=1 Tax=Comamonas thiooxydans TaxID=363952 RepID=A0A096DU03_9BURK|nr:MULTISPECIES: BPSS1780 family membrane protein [Comamonas]KGG86287.1 membrane protein [Comamonas thiooxydans]KGG93261.1 membrane protein [Comamonas thiooxydans]KGG97916.1 membrane protein [Comamonas thiooxydans]KGH06546.1 membrane protein [Comamonas thiooxydans]KGH08934.1 membrane protein [Comamonas thiooxydans]